MTLRADIATELEAAYEVGLNTKTIEVDGITVAFVREGYEPHVIDTAAFDERLRWPAGNAQLQDEGSFIAYLKRYWREHESVVFANESSRLMAIFDYHRTEREGNAGQGGRSVFGAWFAPRFTPAWSAWRAANARGMEQGSLLEFLEARMGEVIEPDGADLREVIQFFKVHHEVGFVSGQNLTNGNVNFTWAEESTATAGPAGQLVVPTEFTVLLQPFKDLPNEARAFKAQLRWRIQRPKVTFSFHFFTEQLDDYLEELGEARRLRISAALGAEPVVFFGAPS